jgi:DNA-binding response OmpR family regulator
METVLIIEDNDLIRENTAEILGMANYKVLTAVNGKAGVELALQQRPDIVICDIMMPGMDGYGVLHVFSKNPDLETVPFIFLSAKTERADIRKGMEGGADDYITKPFQESELLHAVEGRLRKTKVLRKDTPPAAETPKAADANPNLKLESLLEDKKIYTYKKKQILYLEGNEPYKLFFIKKGKVKTYRTSPNGKDFITGIHTAGEFFGYLPLIEGTGYQEVAETLEESDIVGIPKEEFLALLYQNPHVAKSLIKMLANNVTEKEKQLSDLAYNSLRKRTADSLLYLKNKYQKTKEEAASIQISRDDIANLVGASTESLIRTLSDFKSEQLIDIVDSRILILNESKLRHMRN